MRISDWSSDVCSSDLGPLVEELARRPITSVVHSDMARTRALALPLARRCGVPLIVDPRRRERDFGSWEGGSWMAIYRKTGSAMAGTIEAPDSVRPGGGEQTHELGERGNTPRGSTPQGGPTG